MLENLTENLSHRGHIIVTDNFLTSPKLLDILLSRGCWNTGIVKRGCVGMLSILKQYTVDFELMRGIVLTKMHRSKQMAVIVWQDAQPVFLISTTANPVAFKWLSYKRWVGSKQKEFYTSPILLEYQKHMRGVDLIDQHRVAYSSQLQTRKWWHRLFIFVLDSSIGNSYILYKTHMEEAGLVKPMEREKY